MRTVNELLDDYKEALHEATRSGEEISAIWGIVLAMPIFIRLLADIRDAIREKGGE